MNNSDFEKSGVFFNIGGVTDILFILLFATLFLLVVIDLLTPMIHSLFEPIIEGQSFFSLISGVSMLLYGIFWGFLKIDDQIRRTKNYKDRWRIILVKAFSFIGLRRIKRKDLFYFLIIFLIGVAFNFFTSYGVSSLLDLNLILNKSLPQGLLLYQILLVAPFFEEMVFRGVYLSAIQKILGNHYYSAAIGLVLSSFTFGWIHTNQLHFLLIKTIGGLLLGSIFLFKWKKNLVHSFLAHFGINLVGIFLIVI